MSNEHNRPSTAETAAPTQLEQRPNDVWVSLAAAAERLAMSRPYVSMLCRAGKLGEVTETEGGSRQVRQSAVAAYAAALTAQQLAYAEAGSPREAGVAAGLYAFSDSELGRAGNRPLRRAERRRMARRQPE